MKKTKLLHLLKSLSVVPFAMASGELAGQEVETAGVAGAIKPSVEGDVAGEDSRVLFVGSDIFRNELIKTGEEGTAHLMFADQSSLTIGPNSEVIIDRFVYQPETGTGELALSASVGVLRFVGGALSKSGNVTVTTPSGTIGIRGGVMVVEITAGGETYAFFLYGDELTGISRVSDANVLLKQSEHWLRLTPSGEVVDEGEFDFALIDGLLENFVGDDIEVTSYVGLKRVPDNYIGWIKEWEEEEQFEAETIFNESDNVEISS